MEKIIITGNETKQTLQNMMEGKVQYSKVDSKQKLLERIEKYNDTIRQEVVVKKEPIVQDVQIGNVLTGNQYCNIKGYNNRIKFFMNKKYKDEKYTSQEWQEIFKKEGLI